MIKISSYAASQSGKRASWFQKKQLWTKVTRGKVINIFIILIYLQ